VSRVLLLALAALLASGEARAYTALGAGSGRCEHWTRAHKEKKGELVLDEWLLGVVTGYNIARDATLGKGATNASLIEFVDRWCAQHPDDGMPQAATKLLEDLRQRQR
jgi:hypothetical protein